MVLVSSADHTSASTTVHVRGKLSSPTKGAVCRPSRHRLSDEVFPATHESGNTRGTAEFTTMPKVKTTIQSNRALDTTPSTREACGGEGSEWNWETTGQHVKKCAEENTWVSTSTGEQLVETTQALDEPRHQHCEDGAGTALAGRD